MQKVLALDYGLKNVGYATGDSLNKIAFPRGVMDNKNFTYLSNEILAFCLKWEINTIVIGYPFNMNESKPNKMMQIVEKFYSNLTDFFQKSLPEKPMKIVFFDERLSSFEADQVMTGAFGEDYVRSNKNDSFAAKIILERYFASL